MDHETTSWLKQWEGIIAMEYFGWANSCNHILRNQYAHDMVFRNERLGSQLNKQRLRFHRTSFMMWTSLGAGEIYFFLSLARSNCSICHDHLEYESSSLPSTFYNVEEIVSNGRCCAIYDDDRWNRFPSKLYIILFFPRY